MRSEHLVLWGVVALCFLLFFLGWRATAPRPVGPKRPPSDTSARARRQGHIPPRPVRTGRHSRSRVK